MAWYNNLPDMRGLIDNADVLASLLQQLQNSETVLSAPALWQ
jgi:hypothetical protein